MYRGTSTIYAFIIYIHGCSITMITVHPQSSVHTNTAINIVAIVIFCYCYCVVFDNNPILDFKSINI